MRRARRADANHGALREAWLRLGGSWLDLVPERGGEPDALVGWRGEDRLVEIKRPDVAPSRRRPRKIQRDWHESWRGRPVVVVTRLQDLIDLFR